MSEMLKSFNPASGEVVGEIEVTPVDEIDAIVSAAKVAQESWGAKSAAERADLIRPAAEILEERVDVMASTLTREMGKPLARSIGEIRACAKNLSAELDEIVEALEPDEIEDKRVSSLVYRDPLGVCAAITPWNYPVSMIHWMIIPALVAGNTVVLKPSEETPLIGQAYADILIELLPEDVLQVVHGAEEQGRALVKANVDLIAFTGSREAGKHIMAEASNGLKRVILELGGKDPLIVLDDADLARAAHFAATNSFDNTGQACISTERIYVTERNAEAFTRHLVEAAQEWMAVGDGLDEASRLGPMVNARQRDHVLRHIEDAVKRGAVIVAGGAGHRDNFIVPTVLTGVTSEMAISREETFGPVACITTVTDEEEAIRLANDTPFGLGAVVFGDDERARKVARRLTAGMIGVNRGVGGADGTPWVGARESGFNFHHSKEGHRNFTQVRVVSVSR